MREQQAPYRRAYCHRKVATAVQAGASPVASCIVPLLCPGSVFLKFGSCRSANGKMVSMSKTTDLDRKSMRKDLLVHRLPLSFSVKAFCPQTSRYDTWSDLARWGITKAFSSLVEFADNSQTDANDTNGGYGYVCWLVSI